MKKLHNIKSFESFQDFQETWIEDEESGSSYFQKLKEYLPSVEKDIYEGDAYMCSIDDFIKLFSIDLSKDKDILYPEYQPNFSGNAFDDGGKEVLNELREKFPNDKILTGGILSEKWRKINEIDFYSDTLYIFIKRSYQNKEKITDCTGDPDEMDYYNVDGGFYRLWWD